MTNLGSFGFNDTLHVYFNGEELDPPIIMGLGTPGPDFVQFARDMSRFQGQSGTIKFDLNGNGILGIVGSTVRIDNIEFSNTDNEPPPVGSLQFSAATYSVNENGGSATITVTRTGGSAGAVSVTFATSTGTATAGADYTATTQTVSWGDGETSNKSVSIPILDDSVYEGNETLTLTLSNPTGGATLGTPSTAVLTIADNESPPVGSLQFSAATYSVNETSGSATITVTRTGGSAGAVSVTFTTSNGTATAGADYTAVTQTVSWANGETSNKTVSIPILDDNVFEGNETVTLTLSNPTGGATLGTPSTAVLTIADNESPPVGSLQFSAATYSVNETGGSATITVTRTGGSAGAVSGTVATSNGTAIAGADYTAVTQTVSWANGETSNKTVSIPILDDSIYEGNETVNLTLSNPTGGATLGSPSTAVLTIVDNESPPVGSLQFSAATYSVNEIGGSATITVTRTGGSAGAVSVTVTTNNGTATAGTDYTASTQTVSWGDGETGNKSVHISILDDSVFEGNETVNLTLSNPTGGATLGTPSTAVLTIVDNESPPVGSMQFSAATYSVNETGGSATITVTRTGGSAGAVSGTVATSNGTATAGADYTAVTQTVNWADGDTGNKTVSIPILDDSVFEGNKTVNLALSNPTGGATLGTPNTAVLTIVDNESPPVGLLQFSAAAYSVTENGGSATITVTRIGGSAGAVSVTFATSNGTATAGADYTATTRTVSWVDGETSSKSVSIPILDDSLFEGNETVNLTLSNPMGGATLGSPSTAVLTIVDNESPPVGSVQFSATTYSVNETGGSATITVTRTGGSAGAVSVTVATSNGTATVGADYTAVPQTVSWANGETSNKSVSIPILDDSIYEGDETVNLTLSNPTGGATLGSPSTAVLTIVDNELPPVGSVQFSAATYNVNENGGSATITVTRTGGSAGAVSVTITTSNGTATAGTDYTATIRIVSWADGDTAPKTVSIPILDDTTYEGNETVNFTLSNPTGGATLGSPSTAVLTIVDNELPPVGSVQFSAATYSVSEHGGSATMTVTRSGGSAGAVNVTFTTSNGTATAGADYTTTTQTVSWGDGETSNKSVSISILDDSVYEGNETVMLTLSNPTGGATLGTPSTAVLTIVDNESPPVGSLQFSAATYSVTEHGGSATITVTRTGGSAGAVSVTVATSNGTATAGADYTAVPQTVSWANGETSNKTVSVPILDDSVFEGNETVNLTLSNPTGGATLGTPSTAVLTITDNDSGLRGEYFDNADLTNLMLTRVDPTIDFDYGRGAPPDTPLGADTFSIRWTGKLQTDVTETYAFELETDDGVRLWIDGHLVVDYWQTGRASNVGMMDLTAGLHDIKIEFFEETDNALVQLYWSSPSMPDQVIVPQDHLSPPEAVGVAPQLAWTEEPSYCSNGLDPEVGNTHTSFTYRVKYTDADGNAPMAGYPRVHILQGGKEINGSPFAMALASGTPAAGAVYTYTTKLPVGKDYTYYFDAKDATSLQAVATPITPTPVVALNAPSVIAAPTLALRLNQCVFRSGETLTLTASVTPGDTPQVVDVYVAVRLPEPDGSLLFLQGDGSVTTSVRPIVTGWTIAPFTGAIFRYTFGGGEPRGSYAWLGAFTVPGTMNFIGEIVQAPFTFRP